MAAVTLQNRKSEPNLADLLVQSAEGAVLLSSEQRPSHVLMTIADYERINSGKLNIVEKLWMPDMPDIDFDPVRSNESSPVADFS